MCPVCAHVGQKEQNLTLSVWGTTETCQHLEHQLKTMMYIPVLFNLHIWLTAPLWNVLEQKCLIHSLFLSSVLNWLRMFLHSFPLLHLFLHPFTDFLSIISIVFCSHLCHPLVGNGGGRIRGGVGMKVSELWESKKKTRKKIAGRIIARIYEWAVKQSEICTHTCKHTCVWHLSKSIAECNRHEMPADHIRGVLLKPLTLHTYSLTYKLLCDTCSGLQTHTQGRA